jgi:hypothetical protein
MSDVAYRAMLVVPPMLVAVGLFIFGWYCTMKEGWRYLTADLPLTNRQRRYLATMFTVSGNPVQPPSYLSDAERSALIYMPPLKSALKRLMIGMIAMIIFLAYVASMTFFGFLR